MDREKVSAAELGRGAVRRRAVDRRDADPPGRRHLDERHHRQMGPVPVRSLGGVDYRDVRGPHVADENGASRRPVDCRVDVFGVVAREGAPECGGRLEARRTDGVEASVQQPPAAGVSGEFRVLLAEPSPMQVQYRPLQVVGAASPCRAGRGSRRGCPLAADTDASAAAVAVVAMILFMLSSFLLMLSSAVRPGRGCRGCSSRRSRPAAFIQAPACLVRAPGSSKLRTAARG